MATDLAAQAEEFFALPQLSDVSPERRATVQAEILRTGSYRHTEEELRIGAQLAWRNQARCIGRASSNSLELIDARDAKTPADIAEACFQHLLHSTNNGHVKSMITIFDPPVPGARGAQIMNPQLIRYAAYRQKDGTILGDPAHLELTDYAHKLGWQGEKTAFDVLPLIIHAPGFTPQWFEIPRDIVLEVPMTHPDFPWFADLGLKWHAVPAISNMNLEIGGVVYTAAPFNGWYLSAEIGARNFSDENRYNLLPVVAEKMGLTINNPTTLWKDRALVELNIAVLHSFRAAGVQIVDHHTVAKQFVKYVERETSRGNTVPTDWTWVNPPISSGLTPTFHRYYDDPDSGVGPAFTYRDSISLGCPVMH